jgi:ribosomal-protein-alanine N-acetyltransferase
MRFSFRPLRWRDIWTIARWRYPGPYAVYNMGVFALASNMLVQSLLALYAGPVYYAVRDEHGELVGIFSFIPQGETVEVGLGLRPDLTGQASGLGLTFVLAGLDFARQRFHPARFRLTVAAFNTRAIRVYERAGFVAEQTTKREHLGKLAETIEMSRQA